MTLIRNPKNVYCHMECVETKPGSGNYSAGQIAVTIYATMSAAAEDMRGLMRCLTASEFAKDVADFLSDERFPRIEWNSLLDGKRHRRFITDLPFFN